MKTLIGIFVFLSISAYGQDKILLILESKPEIFTCDNFDNVYIYSKNTLKKYNSKGISEAQYSSLAYGQITSVDVSDPMKIVVFYKDFNMVLILDKKLNPLGEPIYLDQIGYTSVDCICKSRQNGIWLFDSFAQKLSLFSLTSKSLIREIDLLRYTKPINYVENIIEGTNEIYFYGKDKAILFMDQLGGKFGIFEIFPASICQVLNGKLVYTDNKNLIYYNLLNTETEMIKMEGFNKFDDIKAGNGKIFVLNSDSITIISKPSGF